MKEGTKTLLTVFGIYGFIILLALYIKIGLFGSLITSSVKAVSGSCGKDYAVEVPYFISGDWFCGER